jgi:multiple sugar transport system permease protein
VGSLAATDTPGRPHARSSRRRRPAVPAPLVLLAPFLLLFLVFMVGPIVWSAVQSLYSTKLVGGTQFSGLDNYSRALSDPSFRGSFGHIGVLALVQIPISLVLALGFALVLDGRAVFARGLFRLGFFIPYAVPTVIAGLLWGFMYQPNIGLLPDLTETIGLGQVDFLTSTGIVPSIANISVWEYTGLAAVIFYTALKAIPSDLEEAAAVDRANAWEIVRSIKLPLIRGSIALMALLSVIGVIQLFNEPQILGTIAPDVIGDHYTPNLYAYNVAFQYQDLNYAAALSFMLGVAVVAGSLVFAGAARIRRGRAA